MNLLNRRLFSRSVLFALILGAAQVVTRDAAAQSVSDKAAAEALFDEARALMKEGKYEAACPKLAESQRLDPAVGTLLYLASCHEKTGKIATAWVTVREAAAAAHRANQPDREKTATSRADALTPLLPRLTIEPDTSRGEPQITRDGVPVSRASWGTPLPVDPGAHVVEVRLAGHKPRSITIEVPKGETIKLPIEPLEPEEALATSAPASDVEPKTAPPVSDVPPAKESPSTLRQTLPYAAAGVGVAGVVVGTIFGLRAFSLASNVEEACPSGPCSRDVVETANDSRTAGNVSTVAFAVGAVGLAAAAVLWLTAPSSTRAAAPQRLTITF